MSDLIRGKELAAKVLEHVIRHPERHNQKTWVDNREQANPSVSDCGTTACLAGWAVLLNADDPQHTATSILRSVRTRVVGPDVEHPLSWHYPEVALKLLFPDYDRVRYGGFWEIVEVAGDTDDPIVLTARAFATISSDQKAIKMFAEAFGLEVG
jgi:hypothetical protein